MAGSISSSIQYTPSHKSENVASAMEAGQLPYRSDNSSSAERSSRSGKMLLLTMCRSWTKWTHILHAIFIVVALYYIVYFYQSRLSQSSAMNDIVFPPSDAGFDTDEQDPIPHYPQTPTDIPGMISAVPPAEFNASKVYQLYYPAHTDDYVQLIRTYRTPWPNENQPPEQCFTSLENLLCPPFEDEASTTDDNYDDIGDSGSISDDYVLIYYRSTHHSRAHTWKSYNNVPIPNLEESRKRFYLSVTNREEITKQPESKCDSYYPPGLFVTSCSCGEAEMNHLWCEFQLYPVVALETTT